MSSLFRLLISLQLLTGVVDPESALVLGPSDPPILPALLISLSLAPGPSEHAELCMYFCYLT